AFRYDYTIYLANGADEALSCLKADPDISIIFSDQKMPGKSGVDFFEEIRSQYPEPIRILITGYADIESVIAAINRGEVFRYIKKPWTETDIHSAIEEAQKFYLTVSLLKKKNEELEKAYAELDRFAYSATHDMRGPILSVLGVIDLMKNAGDLGEVREMTGMIENAMIKLDGYIKSLHEHYSIRRGNLHFTEIDLSEFVEDMSALYDPVAKLKKVRFSKTIIGNGSFRSDLASLKIIISNLLSNAFKYQRRDNVHKTVSLEVEAGPSQVIFTVSDNGIGIPESSQGEIFNIFFRATHEEFGSGFGLYNVKDVLNKLNGKIEVESMEHKGSCFRVMIPNK
ncbi:MAG TPA: hybrid sensor histidine kinase/response regulator, partial [Anseongella sp.]|nr:hybrid sensor histidine kinase/response regulator [Anseongella sp.]